MTPVLLANNNVAGALLAGAVDYAGLFPPASLDLGTTLANYLEYRASPERRALGRLVMPVGRLTDLASLLPAPGSPTGPELSVLIASNSKGEQSAFREFWAGSRRHGAVLAGVEIAPGVVPDSELGAGCYYEIPVEQVSDATIDAIEAVRGSVKLRTGGVTPAAFPSTESLAGALALLGRRRMAFKATAGLHHPLRGTYRLTYAEGAPAGTMFGYLNLMMASLLAWGGEPVREIEAALLISDAGELSAEEQGLGFLGRRYPVKELEEMRRDFFHSFGSCSFREPIDEWPFPEGR